MNEEGQSNNGTGQAVNVDPLVSLFDEFPDHPLPEWAERVTRGEYMVVGAQLRTRDGRRLGNAFVNEIYLHEQLKENVAVCYTDAGSRFTFTLSELEDEFYPPVFIMKIENARAKFIRG